MHFRDSLDEELARETSWFDTQKPKWEKLGYVAQDDLDRFCKKYVPAIIRSAPDNIDRVFVAVAWVGRTGVFWSQELLNWEMPGKPPNEQIILLSEMMGRAAQQISARNRVRKIFFDIAMKKMFET